MARIARMWVIALVALGCVGGATVAPAHEATEEVHTRCEATPDQVTNGVVEEGPRGNEPTNHSSR
jgi:hypothetical protein